MIRRPPRSTPLYSSAASDVYKRQASNSQEGLEPVSTLHPVGQLPDGLRLVPLWFIVSLDGKDVHRLTLIASRSSPQILPQATRSFPLLSFFPLSHLAANHFQRTPKNLICKCCQVAHTSLIEEDHVTNRRPLVRSRLPPIHSPEGRGVYAPTTPFCSYLVGRPNRDHQVKHFSTGGLRQQWNFRDYH